MLNHRKLFLTLLLAIAFAIGPHRIVIQPNGTPKPVVSAAFAASGSGSDGDGGEDDESDESDDDDDDDDDEADDDDEGNNDESDDDEDDDEEDDDGEDETAPEESGSSSGSQSQTGKTTSLFRPSGPIVRVEVSRSGIEIQYANGAREEIENGTYELRDTTGRRVVRRDATGADVARLKAVSTRVSIRSVTRRDPRKSDIRNVETSGDSVSVAYSNGWTETIANGMYQLTDPYQRMVAARPASRADRSRMAKLAGRR